MRKLSFFLCVLTAAFLVAGCAKPPETDVQAARAALESARSAEATEYASESMQAADDAMKALEAELQVQEGKFALFRSYKDAKAKAAEVTAAGQKAMADAQAGKERMRAQATEAITQGRAKVEEVKMLLEKAPTGKGTAADIAALKSDCMNAETMLTEADAALAAGRMKDAMAKATACMSACDQVKMAVEAAIAAKGMHH